MKKIVLLFALIGMACVWPNAAVAEGIAAGDQVASGSLGFSVPLQESGIYAVGTELDWGGVGASYGLSYTYFLSPYFGLGAEVSGSSFDKADMNVYFLNNHTKIESSMETTNVMAVFRANLNPESKVRFYIPFGAGLTSAKGKIEVSDGFRTESVDGRNNSFGWFLGAGLEFDVNDRWMLGGEMRYQAFSFDTAKYNMNNVSSKENYGYLSFLFKAGYRF